MRFLMMICLAVVLSYFLHFGAWEQAALRSQLGARFDMVDLQALGQGVTHTDD